MKIETPIQYLEFKIKVLESFKYKNLSEMVQLLLSEQKTEEEIDNILHTVEKSIQEYKEAINALSLIATESL